jgi:hypothetical protein
MLPLNAAKGGTSLPARLPLTMACLITAAQSTPSGTLMVLTVISLRRGSVPARQAPAQPMRSQDTTRHTLWDRASLDTRGFSSLSQTRLWDRASLSRTVC